jgi:lysyl-tRNA synthetase class 1
MKIHWADVVAEDLLKKRKKHRIATGISPSGPIHLGNLREMLTADAVRRALVDKGGKAEIVYIADTFDPLRKRYPFLPEEYEKYVGMPLSEIPDPDGCHESYAEHFLAPFLESLAILGIDVVIERADRMYKEGRYKEQIRIALENKEKIAKIIEEVTGRGLEPDWNPFMPLCEACGKIGSAKVKGCDDKLYYTCSCGHEGKASYKGGKLSWRVDWAARWKILGITCEPFGKDHAAAGGSYATGTRFAREVFGIEPPFPIVYEWIHLKGFGAMKSSKGIVIPVKEMVEVLPPEIVRYIIIRSKPERHIEFDPGMGLLDMVEEFEEAVKENDRATQLSIVKEFEYSEVPFKHLIVVGQIAEWDLGRTLDILARSYPIDDVTKKDVERRLTYARKWLERFAPQNLKFEISEVDVELNKDEKGFLLSFADSLSEEMNAEEIHALVYEMAKKEGMKTPKAFQAIYRAILGRDYGPRAGYFIKSLGIEWVKERLRRASKQVGSKV